MLTNKGDKEGPPSTFQGDGRGGERAYWSLLGRSGGEVYFLGVWKKAFQETLTISGHL
jgi:hypothetical protein